VRSRQVAGYSEGSARRCREPLRTCRAGRDGRAFWSLGGLAAKGFGAVQELLKGRLSAQGNRQPFCALALP
jgi:hypothetical protein